MNVILRTVLLAAAILPAAHVVPASAQQAHHVRTGACPAQHASRYSFCEYYRVDCRHRSFEIVYLDGRREPNTTLIRHWGSSNQYRTIHPAYICQAS